MLSEVDGNRRLPIIIGGFEAQAIAIELEKMTPTRPLTHDLFKSFAEAFTINIVEVIIYNLTEGIFYSKLICEQNGMMHEVDARTSDAIAIAVRFGCPVYTYEDILSSAGMLLDGEEIDSDEFLTEAEATQEQHPTTNQLGSLSVDELRKELEQAIEQEDYETASRIRDEINKRKA